jgi:hypothetical protein
MVRRNQESQPDRHRESVIAARAHSRARRQEILSAFKLCPMQIWPTIMEVNPQPAEGMIGAPCGLPTTEGRRQQKRPDTRVGMLAITEVMSRVSVLPLIGRRHGSLILFRCRRRLPNPGGERECERASFAGLALDRHVAVHSATRFPNNAEAKAEDFPPRGLPAAKAAKNQILFILRDPHPVVAYAEEPGIPFLVIAAGDAHPPFRLLRVGVSEFSIAIDNGQGVWV